MVAENNKGRRIKKSKRLGKKKKKGKIIWERRPEQVYLEKQC